MTDKKWMPYNPTSKDDFILEAQYAMWCNQYPYARRILYLLAKYVDTPDHEIDPKEFLP